MTPNDKGGESVIYTDCEQPIDDALKTMTDQWIENGSYCEQTVIDLRDRMIEMREAVARLVAARNAPLSPDWNANLCAEFDRFVAAHPECNGREGHE